MRGETNIVDLLKGGDRRSIGKSNKAATLASEQPRAFGQLIRALCELPMRRRKPRRTTTICSVLTRLHSSY